MSELTTLSLASHEPGFLGSNTGHSSGTNGNGHSHPAPTATGVQPEPETIDREQLFRDFRPLVRRLIRQYSSDAESREDLEGEIYCRFCALVDAFDPSRGIPLRAYLVRTLAGSVYTFSRSQWRREQREVSLEGSLQEDDPVVSQDPTAQWDFELMSRDVLKALPDAIATLPERQRRVLVWRYYDSRSFEEIAKELGVQTATARSLLRHALTNLRQRIAQQRLLWD